jgi:C1A family cysteine protease
MTNLASKHEYLRSKSLFPVSITLFYTKNLKLICSRINQESFNQGGEEKWRVPHRFAFTHRADDDYSRHHYFCTTNKKYAININ